MEIARNFPPDLLFVISIQHPTRRAEISTLEEVERMHIQRVLEKTAGVVGGPHGAATLLGMKRTTLIDRMRKLGIYKMQQL